MPAGRGEQRPGGGILAVVGSALALGAVLGVGCVLARGRGGPTEGKEAVHKDLLHHAGSSRSRLVVMTSPQPTEQGYHEKGHQAKEHAEKEHLTTFDHSEMHLHIHHTNETPHHGHNRTNETRHGHNRTSETRHGHNRTNETHYGHNRTNERHRHGHKHKHCLGGSLAACECMLKCEVFGGNASMCGGRSGNGTKQLVDAFVLRAMLSHKNMCDGMRCITRCAEELGCLDDKVLDDCRAARRSYAESKSEADPECNLHCSS